MIKVVIELEIETEASAADVRREINAALDMGVLQDAINASLDIEMQVTSALCKSVE